MQKVNTSPLHCIHDGCPTIPTIVLEFQHPSGMRIMGQILTCSEHRQEGVNRGNEMFGKGNLREFYYPPWLQRVHTTALDRGIVGSNPIAPEDGARLTDFIRELCQRRSAEKR